MFNAMEDSRMRYWGGDGTKKTHYNGSTLMTNIIDARAPHLSNTLNQRSVSTYMMRGGQQHKGRIGLRAPIHPKFPPFYNQAYLN